MKLNDLAEQIENIKIDITEDQVLDYLKIKYRWPFKYSWDQNSVEVINNLGKGCAQFFDGHGYFLYEEWLKYYDLGYTSIISNVMDLNKDLRELQTLILKTIGSNVNGNFYFSKPGQKPSFDKHRHSYPVIVKQIYGGSTWIIDKKRIILTPQRTLLIDSYTEHEVVTKENKKLSLTLNID